VQVLVVNNRLGCNGKESTINSALGGTTYSG
jgi:hypothetical protein